MKIFNLKPSTYHLKPSTKGFTLIELLVVISLFVALTTIALFSQSKFNGSILLTNLAYDVALTIRQAQSFGVNVREASGSFQYAYGVHFDTNKNQFLMFVDSNDNSGYNGSWTCNGGADECIESYSIKRGNKISGLCVGPSCTVTNTLDIIFKRPNPDAYIIDNAGNVNIEAAITISSADGINTRTVVVNKTGQISVRR